MNFGCREEYFRSYARGGHNPTPLNQLENHTVEKLKKGGAMDKIIFNNYGVILIEGRFFY